MKRFKDVLLSGSLSVAVTFGLVSTLWSSTAYASTTPSKPPTATVKGKTWVQVSTAAQLEYIDEHQSSYLTSSIELMNDIKLPTGYQWIPIGGRISGTNYAGATTYTSSSPEAPFTGTFDGLGHQITGVVINDSTDEAVGFFGEMNGTVEKVGISAQVTSVLGGVPGGLSNETAAGALAGSLQNTGATIVNSYAIGSVSGGNNNGGLVGSLTNGSIVDSYSLVKVSSSSNNGGLVGNYMGGSMTDCYAAGPVTGGTTNGGIIGSAYTSASFQGLYFDTQATRVSAAVGYEISFIGPTTGVNGLQTTGMQTPSTFTSAAWSTSTWALFSGYYPLLQWQIASSMAATPTNVLPGGQVTVTGTVYASGGTPLSGIKVTLSDNAGGSWLHSSVMTDASGKYTDTWTASSSTTTATLTASVNATSVQEHSTIHVEAYTVSYNGNGSGSGTVPTDSNSYTSGMNATVLGNTGNLTKTGYTFAGWNTKADGKGTSYASGSTLPMGSANAVLYAQWRIDPTISTSSTLPNVLEGTLYNQELKGTGGLSPYTFSIASGSLPKGLTLQSNGSLVGTPQQSGTFHFTVQLKDHEGTTTIKNMSLYVIPAAPTGYFKTVTTKQVVGHSGGTLTTNSSKTKATLVIISGTFTDPLQMDVTTGTVSANLVPSGWKVVGAYGVNFDTTASPSHPLSFTLLNAGITPQSKVYKIVNGKLVPVTATVTQGKAVITFTKDPDFVVLQPQPVAKATTPSTGFPAIPWAAGGFLAVLFGSAVLWWRRSLRR